MMQQQLRNHPRRSHRWIISQTPEGDVGEVKIDQNGDEVEEDEDGEITEQARNLKTLNQY